MISKVVNWTEKGAALNEELRGYLEYHGLTQVPWKVLATEVNGLDEDTNINGGNKHNIRAFPHLKTLGTPNACNFFSSALFNATNSPAPLTPNPQHAGYTYSFLASAGEVETLNSERKKARTQNSVDHPAAEQLAQYSPVIIG